MKKASALPSSSCPIRYYYFLNYVILLIVINLIIDFSILKINFIHPFITAVAIQVMIHWCTKLGSFVGI